MWHPKSRLKATFCLWTWQKVQNCPLHSAVMCGAGAVGRLPFGKASWAPGVLWNTCELFCSICADLQEVDGVIVPVCSRWNSCSGRLSTLPRAPGERVGEALLEGDSELLASVYTADAQHVVALGRVWYQVRRGHLPSGTRRLAAPVNRMCTEPPDERTA